MDLDRGYGGAGLRWTRATALISAPFTASIGLDYDRMAERRTGLINNFGVSEALKRNEDDVVTATGLYAQAEWRMAPRWMTSSSPRAKRSASAIPSGSTSSPPT